MKRFTKILCVLFALILSLGAFTACEKKPGLYNWMGRRINVDYALRLVLDIGDGKQEYLVPFDEYYGIFMYYKSLLGDGILEDENHKLLFTTVDEQTKAIKEKTEDDLIEYYALYAIAEKYGVGLTQEDYDSFENEYKANLIKYLEQNGKTDDIEDIGSYTDDMYQKLFERLGTTEAHVKFSYLRTLLSSRVKKHISPDAVQHAEKNYFHIKQVLVLFTKGDASSEKEAQEKINAAKAELDAGASINDVIKKYDSGISDSEIYFDSGSAILGAGNTDASSVTSFVSMTVNGMEIGDAKSSRAITMRSSVTSASSRDSALMKTLYTANRLSARRSSACMPRVLRSIRRSTASTERSSTHMRRIWSATLMIRRYMIR